MEKPAGLRPKKLVLITGLPGSGKSTLAKQLASAGVKVLTMGDVVRNEASRRGVGADIDSMRNLMVQLRGQHGDQYVAEMVCQELGRIADDPVVIDGVRSWAEVEYFRARCRKAVLVAVVSPPNRRFDRLKARGRKDDPRTPNDLRRRDVTELSVGMGQAIERADVKITNDGSLKELRNRAMEILEGLRKD